MTYELALISVVIGAGYWGWFYVRQRPHGTATFGVMQLAAAGLSALGLLGHRIDAAWLGVPGAIGLGAGVCLLVVGPVARVLARQAVGAERMALATRLLDLAELLAPGSGVAEEKALVRAMADIREGRIDQTVDALTRARERAPADARLAIDERIAMLYLAAHRWSDAISHAEAHLFGALPAAVPGGDGDGSLRRALGLAPPVWVDLLAAYGRIGDLDQAARMLVRLEDACAGRDDAALWLHRGRMMFLALAGRTDAVRALVAPRQSRHMSVAARTYWIAVAHEHHGDRDAAALAYGKARARSRGRPRDLIDQALAGLAGARRVELAPVASEVVARVEAAPPPPRVRIARPPSVRATWVLTALLLAVSATTAIAVGDTADLGVLVRAGAVARGMIDAGEWWRVVSAVFVHAGALHLVVNAVGLVLLGFLVEDLFGTARMIAIFAVAGIAGAAASYAASPGGVSAGASGAVLGLLGAVFVEVIRHGEHYAKGSRRALWGSVIVIAVTQLGYWFLSDAIDQWAHGGGLFAGAVLGAALSPSARWTRAGQVVGRAIAIGFGAAVVIAGALTVRTSLADSLARGGVARVAVARIALDLPAGWMASTGLALKAVPVQLVGAVVQPDGLARMQLLRGPRTAVLPQIDRWLDEERQHGGDGETDGRSGSQTGSQGGSAGDDEERRDGEDPPERVEPASEALVALPSGWEGREVTVVRRDGMGYDQRSRRLMCGASFGDQTIFAVIEVPETIAAAAPEFFARLLASIAPA